jgi:predicted MFS family arabinose efflux permease
MTNVEQSYSSAALVLRWSILAFALFLVGTNSFVIAGVLPEISHAFGATTSDIGYTITLYAIVVAVLAPAIAVAAPRWSRTVLMVAGLAAFVAGVVIAAAAPDFAVFAIGRVVAAVGGAALVPTATAAGAAITAPARRGQAIAVVGIGFTLASAIGAPLGTALAAATDWRIPMYAIAVLSVIVIPVLGAIVRRVPLGEPISIGRRFAVLRDGRILLPLATTLLLVAGFNILYIFSSEVTGFGGTTLAALLLVYGIMGIIGNTISGPLTDRFGSRRVGAAFMIVGRSRSPAWPSRDGASPRSRSRSSSGASPHSRRSCPSSTACSRSTPGPPRSRSPGSARRCTSGSPPRRCSAPSSWERGCPTSSR